MLFFKKLILGILLLSCIFIGSACSEPVKEIERPEKIKSKRNVVYDKETYDNLAIAWAEYYDEFPSEDAYANWMYAARYAGHEDYEERLEAGLEKYAANPTLLYLSSMLRHGKPNHEEGRRQLERALALDPSFVDPWFSLVAHYIEQGEMENMDVALRRILETAAISEEVMDYNYNLLAGLEEDAILITNGDNDTYPGWILTRLLDHRSDVRIVNRSLLNTSWYPLHVIEEGVPRFITGSELEDLRERTKGKCGDELIVRLIEASEREGRPVYFSLTLYPSDVIDPYFEKGRMLALATLVTSPRHSYARQLTDAAGKWVNEFRTGGIDSWKVHYAKPGDAGSKLMMNYAANICKLIGPLKEHAPDYLPDMFNWYREHCVDLLLRKDADEMGMMWSEVKDVGEIRAWCLQQGYIN
jgi:tetratricopeptide (TPR) repeat protein